MRAAPLIKRLGLSLAALGAALVAAELALERWFPVGGVVYRLDAELLHTADARSKKEQRRERAASRQSLSHLKKEVRQLEAQLEETTADLQRLETTLADEKTYSELPPDELNELLTKAGARRQTLERVEEQWLEAVARLESYDEN